MKRLLTLLLLAPLGFTSCDKDGCNPAQNSGSFEEDKAIVVHYNEDAQQDYHHIGEGENLVFRYSHSAAQCDDIMDDEWGYNLTFEVDKDATTFRFEGTELPVAKGFYKEFGAWVGGNTYPLEGGKIEGSRMAGGKWRVKVDVTIAPLHTGQQTKHISFDRIFAK